MPNIQTTYPNAQELGQVGQKARTSAPWDADRIKIGAVGLKAGDLFTLDGSGDAIPLSADAPVGVEAVEGVLLFEVSLLNDETTGEIPNYAVGDHVPYCREGYVFVAAGSTGVARGDAVTQDLSEHDYITTGAPVANLKKVLTAETDAADGELFVLKVGAKLV